MYLSAAKADEILTQALKLAAEPADDTIPSALHQALERIPAPIYITDAEGLVIWFNAACAPFTGRSPRAGEDRWCVTWKLYTDDGEALPHDQCPMAQAIREQQPVRGLTAIVERPDGTRVNVLPYPTPLRDAAGRFAGAVNLLADITDLKQAESLRAQAARCRRLSADIRDVRAKDALTQMAEEYAAKAGEMEARLSAA